MKSSHAWSPDSWKSLPGEQLVTYADGVVLENAVKRLSELPPLVTSWEVEQLKALLAQAQVGKRFLLQGGDCAETLDDCKPDVISNKLKILLQMSLVIVHGSHKPVVRVGRFAGQYAKPRTDPTETRQEGQNPSVTLTSYFGDLVNDAAFTEEARRADPMRLLQGYFHASLTMNFIRSLTKSGFADLHHPEYWDLSFLQHAALAGELREQYQQASRELASSLRFMEALGETSVDDMTRVEFFASHEGLNLHYESAQTRQVPRRKGYYDLTTHMPWIGERTRGIDRAHVEFFRGIQNPIGVKLGPTAQPDAVVDLCRMLNPSNEAGKVVLIVRMGASKVTTGLPPLIKGIEGAKQKVLWVSDPMHGNTEKTSNGYKTRNVDNILRELEHNFDVHQKCGTILGGVHFELTGDDVTECIGGAAGVTQDDLSQNYATLCDPRLNYQQSLEMAFHLAHRMRV